MRRVEGCRQNLFLESESREIVEGRLGDLSVDGRVRRHGRQRWWTGARVSRHGLG
jgi:hypothetical protein